MVAESVAAKVFKIGSVVVEIWPFYLITLCSAIVSIKFKVKGQVDLWGHKVGRSDL